MKNFVRILLISALLIPTGSAWAQLSDEVGTVDETFLYRFDFVLRTGVLEQVGIYQIETGDVPPGSGYWQLVLEGPNGRELTRQSFDPSSGRAVVRVRYQPNGTTARILNQRGEFVSSIPLIGSRVCDEDGYCEARYGEQGSNCSADCGSGYTSDLSAAIVPQNGIGKKIGALLLGLALAAAGLLLVRGLNGILDRRSGPYDNA